jgi:hypothetical protein
MGLRDRLRKLLDSEARVQLPDQPPSLFPTVRDTKLPQPDRAWEDALRSAVPEDEHAPDEIWEK